MSKNPIGNSDHARCANCGYDLFGLPHDICPECGEKYDPNRQHPMPRWLSIGTAMFSLAAAGESIWHFTDVALDRIDDRGLHGLRLCGRAFCHRTMVGMFELVAFGLVLIVWYFARHNPITRRIILNALLATITALVTCLVMLDVR